MSLLRTCETSRPAGDIWPLKADRPMLKRYSLAIEGKNKETQPGSCWVSKTPPPPVEGSLPLLEVQQGRTSV